MLEFWQSNTTFVVGEFKLRLSLVVYHDRSAADGGGAPRHFWLRQLANAATTGDLYQMNRTINAEFLK